MNMLRRFAAAISVLLLTAPAGGAAPAHPGAGCGRPTPPPTVEPTLPLTLDLSLEGVEKAPGGVRARLVLELNAFADLGEVSIRPILPPGLLAEDDDAVPKRLARLTQGPSRRFVLPLLSAGAGKRPIRVEVEFDDASGRHFRLGQGITLDPDPAPDGKLVAGAYEVMATPIEKVGH